MTDTNIHELNKTAEEKRAAAKQQAHEAQAKAGEAQQKMQSAVSDAASTAASSAQAKLEEFGIYTDQMADTARRKTYEMQDALVEEIRANPIRSVAIAAAFGYLLAVYRRL